MMNKRVLIAVDESTPAMHAFDHALEAFPEASITALHVLDVGELFRYADADVRAEDLQNIEESEQLRRESAEDLFERLRERAADRGVEIETVLDEGKPADRIVNYAEESDVDHIVIGSHGRSGVSRILLGSIAESVARRAPTPVTIVR